MQLDLFENIYHKKDSKYNEKRRCNRCKENVTVDLFSIHRKAKSGLQGMCQPCNQKYQQDIQYLRKIVPPRPNKCQCCGVKSDSLQLDHDRNTVEFRGWICCTCNTGLGSLGDTIEGLEIGIKYLKGYYEQHRTQDTDKVTTFCLELPKEA